LLSKRGGYRQVDHTFNLFPYSRQFSQHRTSTLDYLSDRELNSFSDNQNQSFGLVFSGHFDILQMLAKIKEHALKQEFNILLLLPLPESLMS